MKIDLYDERGNLVATRVLLEVAAARMELVASDLSWGLSDGRQQYARGILMARRSGADPALTKPWRHK